METIFEDRTSAVMTPESDALSERPRTASRVAVAMLFLANGTLFGTWVSRIPAVQAGRGLSHGVLGMALLVMALGALVAMPLAGRFSLRFGSHRVCQATAVVFAMGLPLLGWAPGFPLFLAVLFCFGMSHGALDVAMNAQAVVVEKRYPRPIMSSFHALFSVGGLIGASLGGVAAGIGIAPGWHFAGASLVLAAITGAVSFSHLLDDRDPARRQETGQNHWTWPSRGLVAIGVVAFCVMMGEGAMADWTGIFLRKNLQASEGMAAAGYAAFSIAMAGTRFFGDRLSLRLGPTGLVRWSGVLALGGLGLALLSQSPMVALVGFGAVGIGFATVVPVAFSAAGRTPGVSPGVALATASTVGYFGFLVGPPIIGFAAEAMGLRAALAILLVTSTMMVVLAKAVGFAGGERRAFPAEVEATMEG